jgi:predicted RNA-binding Zn ribbon-like protein
MAIYESAFTRPPAPPPLDLVQAFLNSVDLEDGVEEFASVASLESWVAAHIPETAGTLREEDRLHAIATREALRDVVEGDPSGKAAQRLQHMLDGIPMTMRLDGEDHIHLVSTRGGFDALLTQIMAGVHHAMIDGTWQRLKICRNDVCRWAFYDASRNRSAVWCSMATCGSQAKARAYRTRTKRKVSR